MQDWASRLLKSLMVLTLLLVSVPATTIAASNVGDIEYEKNSLTPTEQQIGGHHGGISLNPVDWNWKKIGDFFKDILDKSIEGVKTGWKAFTEFLSKVGELIASAWDALPDWVKDLIVTIGIILAVIAVIVLLVVGGIITVAVAIVAAIGAIIAGVVYFLLYGGTDAFNPLHAAGWIFGGALAGGLLAFAVETGAMAAFLTWSGNIIRFGIGKLGLALSTSWRFVMTRALVPAFHATMNAARAVGLWFRLQVAKGLLMTNLYRFVHGGWVGLAKHIFGIGLKGAGVSLAFDFVTGNWDPKSMGINAVFAFFTSLVGVGLWTRVNQAVKWERVGWLIYGAGTGAALEVGKQFVKGEGINWGNVGISSLVFGTLIPMNMWINKAGLSGLLVDFAKKYPPKFLTETYKDIIYWNSPDMHPDNRLKNIWNGYVDAWNNFKYECSAGVKYWYQRLFWWKFY
ncbi:hypothetical protein ACFFF5_10760 [Lederbergia wuyishanensis]|uniref:Uncharacterized protein n=1 Tax=Lederbergia wuyishanensis TaxID=1347903 RepID=A0ABU0D6P8_9BACI|nr:hypothetical protein [Lederbergia wuyishanensis]MCJ8008764.1 hypothetical protein [Lederbergia wuyishanensis]MDQ0344084.1 hypothetical protein [Lederbergia wuyishanensis]